MLIFILSGLSIHFTRPHNQLKLILLFSIYLFSIYLTPAH